MMVLVTGAGGLLGSRVVRELLGRVHAVRVLVRNPDQVPDLTGAVIGSLNNSTAVADSVDGVDAIIHCASDPDDHKTVDIEGTRLLVEAAGRAGSPHIVYPGIVGSDVIPMKYYKSKIAAEHVVAGSVLPYSILRTTQFHHLVWGLLDRLSGYPVMMLPAGTRAQPIDAGDVAKLLVDTVESGPSRHMDPIGGPTAYDVRDLATSHRAVTGHSKRLLEFNFPGLAATAFRAGGNLTPNKLEGGRTWNDFVASQMKRLAQN